MEMMHAAQALTLRRQKEPSLSFGRGTEAAFNEYRKTVSWYDKDRNLSVDIKASYEIVKSGKMLEAANPINQK